MCKRKSRILFLIVVLIVGVSIASGGCIGGGPESSTKTYDVTSEAPSGTMTGGDIGKPVRATVKDYKGTRIVEVTVLDYIRGEKANRMINDTNRFNDKPKAGYEYLLVKVRVRYIKGAEELRMSPLYFKAFSRNVGTKYSWIVMPEETPKFESTGMTQGGEVEGWMAFEVAQNEEVQLKYYPNLVGDPVISIRIPSS
ncbi:DUF4352 domain-containing protein [Thermococcus sp.]